MEYPEVLAPPQQRHQAVAVLGALAALDPPTTGLLISTVDIVSGAVLRGLAGLSADDARAVLREVWSR